MKPEEKARLKIDQWLTDAGWKVIDRDEFEADSSAVAVREGLLKGNKEADYFLFINGKAVGVLEAKREEIDVTTSIVCEQVEGYARLIPSYYSAYQRPLPFLFTSNGKHFYFRDYRKPFGLSVGNPAKGSVTPSISTKRLGLNITKISL